VAWCKQMRLGRADLRRELLERSNVIQNPEAAPVSGHREVVEPLLNGQPVDWRVRKPGLQRLPILPVVKGNVEPTLRAQIEESLTDGIFTHAVSIVQHVVRNPG